MSVGVCISAKDMRLKLSWAADCGSEADELN